MADRLAPPRSAGDTLVLAGIDVRALAESARAGGWRVIALDLFGDRDTRRASVHWAAIGDAAALRLDAPALAAELRAAAGDPRVAGWVPASGFEGALALLELGSALPSLATAAAQQRRLRSPGEFFAALDRLALPHPEVALRRPAVPSGWLAKRAGGCGGAHVRPAEASPHPAADTYWQRLQPGTPMSALFLADGARATLVALNEQLVEARPGAPYVYAGAVGPVDAPALAGAIGRALARLVPEFELRGLASLDFIAADDGTPWLLEINARPSATMQLHDDAWPGGLMRAHVQAVRGLLPGAPPRGGDGLRGHRIVYARRPVALDAARAAALAADPAHHDLPAAGARFAAGDPVCSVDARAASADALRSDLQRRADAVHDRLTLAEECLP